MLSLTAECRAPPGVAQTAGKKGYACGCLIKPALHVLPACLLQILNFSIAYGKTAHGLSKDWGVSLQEAEETVARWYADR